MFRIIFWPEINKKVYMNNRLGFKTIHCLVHIKTQNFVDILQVILYMKFETQIFSTDEKITSIFFGA